MTRSINKRRVYNFPIFALSFFFLRVFSTNANIVINEIAYKGTGESICDNEDWIELLNTSEDEVASLANFMIHDSKGEKDEDTMTFSDIALAPGEFLLLCGGSADFSFGIGADDTITLLDETRVILDSVILPGTGAEDGSETYARIDEEYKYGAPTPGEVNVSTEGVSREEALQAQNNAGNDFFLVDGGTTFSKVVDIHISMEGGNLSNLKNHPAWEKYFEFNAFSVTNIDNTNTTKETVAISRSVATSSGGKIRTKGRWSKTMTACLGLPNVPFQIKFDTPFLGMEKVYLRNHQDDYSFMRDHSSHTMLKAFGLPYARTRPTRLFLNGSYIGFYTLMEAPTQEYVMQRSFGVFDPKKAALFKGKGYVDACPYSISSEIAAQEEMPDPYYFERGEHRNDIPVLGFEGYGQCIDFNSEETRKEYDDLARGFLEYDKNCGLALVEMGVIDRDYGPKTMEAPMIKFLETKYFNESVVDLTNSVDIDQWLKNFAVYAVMINLDSPMTNINNWYIASTNGGDGDWKIVQYDHHGVMSKSMASYGCDASCAPRMAYWPILQPTCSNFENHEIMGRILNNEENMQKYLEFVQEFINILSTQNIIENLYDYGDGIKKFVVDDPWSHYSTLAEYEESELGRSSQDYNTDSSPFLKTMQFRLQEVQKQLDAIQEGTLPRDGVYDEESVCPDWRDASSEDYIPDLNERDDNFLSNSGSYVESDACVSDLYDCTTSEKCFDHRSGMCAFDGKILTTECGEALTFCKPCFPNSRCSSGAGSTIVFSIVTTVALVGLSWCWIMA